MIQTDIINAIKANNPIIIHRHINPDPDALGSQVGLAETIRASFPDKQVYQVGSDTGNLSWLAEEQTIKDDVYQNALVIVTDTADTPRISDSRFNQGKMLIKIDHHPNDDAYGDLVLLYAGIVGDTGRFLFNNTTPHTLQVAAELIKKDFDPTAINNRMNTVTLGQARLQGYVIDHLKISPAGAASVTVPRTAINDLHLADDQVSAVVGTPGRLDTVVAWAEFIEQAEGGYRVHLRSKGPIINGLAKEHNGGGHPLASGAKAANFDEIIQIETQLDQLVKDFSTTRK